MQKLCYGNRFALDGLLYKKSGSNYYLKLVKFFYLLKKHTIGRHISGSEQQYQPKCSYSWLKFHVKVELPGAFRALVPWLCGPPSAVF